MNQVIGNRIKVKPDSQAEITKGKIARAKDINTRIDTGIITALGDLVDNNRFEVGQHIRFQKYGYEEIKEDGVTYYYIEVGGDKEDVLEILK